MGPFLFAFILFASATIPVTTEQSISMAKPVDCERQCPYIFSPVCATNGNLTENRMFVNVCEMYAVNCDVQKKYRRTRINQCKDYKEYVDDEWLNSHQPSKFKPLGESQKPVADYNATIEKN